MPERGRSRGGRGGLGKKIHALTDGCGRVVAFLLTSANIADITVAPEMLAKIPASRRLLGPSHGLQTNHCRAMDKGYDANSLRNLLKHRKTEAVIPSKQNRKRRIPFDMTAYRDRNMIERAFCRLKDYRRIATRYDKLARNFLAAVMIAATIIWWVD